MGSLYEELLRKFSEISNEESGDHFTPRDIVKLLVSLVFGGDKENLKGEEKLDQFMIHVVELEEC